MTTFAPRWLSRTALSTTLAASLLAGTVATPRAARADEQTVKLIQLLIQKGILSPSQAKDLLKETAGARHARQAAPVEAEAEASAPAAAPPAAPPAAPGQIRVTYVPQFIRKQIADEVRAQVMSEAHEEGWAAPNALPEWTQRFHPYGDLRFRYDGEFFDKNNYNKFINFNSINQGNPFDANSYGLAGSSQTNPPFLNTTQDRNRLRVRARLGTLIDVDDWLTVDFRLGTGSDNSPVSQNQTLGGTGDFSKYSVWIDHAAFDAHPIPGLDVLAGRFATPFTGTSLAFYDELAYDGIAAKYTRAINDRLSVFGTVAGLPLFNTAFDFSTNDSTKFSSTDSYIAAIQGGASYAIRHDVKATLGVALYDFLGVQGAVSQPCPIQPGNVFYCNTDATRTPFEQFGNTLFPIRDNIPNGTTTPPDPQYYGLASRFNVLDVHPRVDITTYTHLPVLVEGEFLDNLAFNRSEIENHSPPNEAAKGPINNVTGPGGEFLGGNIGYMARVQVGTPIPRQLWDWNVSLTYRYLETDATLDAVADNEFHDGGTNARGYILSGNLGVAKNTYVKVKLLSANTVSGPHYAVDSLFVELNSSF